MNVEVEGVGNVEIPDDVVREYVEELDGVEPKEGNNYVFGLNVTHTSELAAMGEDIRNFIETVGAGTVEVQVSVNAKLNDIADMKVGFDTDAVGYIEETEADYWDADDDEEEEYKHGK